MSHRDIRCVAFDAVGTLIHPEPSVSRTYCEIGRKFGSRQSPAEISQRFKRAYQHWEQSDGTVAKSSPGKTVVRPAVGGRNAAPAATQGQTSELQERDRWRHIVTEVLDDVTDPAACFEELFTHFGLPRAWRCFDDVASTLQELRQRGLDVVIASNYDARLHPVCDGLPELADVSCRVISAAVGYRKPSGRFFEALLSATNREPHEVLMVGDDLHNDITGAVAAGLPALWLRRNGDVHSSSDGSYQIIRRLTEIVPLLDAAYELPPS